MQSVKTYSLSFMHQLVKEAEYSLRGRQHFNVHGSYEEPCQRLFNAIRPTSYIRPHRHLSDPKEEFIFAVMGRSYLLQFNDDGGVSNVVMLASEKYGELGQFGVQIPADVWHSLVAIDNDCVILEIKAGPFNLKCPKDFAPWAPPENSQNAQQYLANLVKIAQSKTNQKSGMNR